MPTLRSSVLIVGHPSPLSVSFGADFAADYDQARSAITAHTYPVVVVPSTHSEAARALTLLEFVDAASPLSQKVIIKNDTSAEHLRRLINTGSVFRILPTFSDTRFDLTIQQALEEHALLQQNSKLLQLVNEQNERLKRLTAELEERVEARRKSLEESKERLLVTNHRVEALHRALVAIHRAGSIGEMERLVNDALAAALGLSWTRIVFNLQDHLGQDRERKNHLRALLDENGTQTYALHGVPLGRGPREKNSLGYVYFARPAERPFTRDENSFLGQVADAVALAIDRLGKLEESETLKHQWEATFDAIPEPVSLISSDLTVMRINRAFAEHSGTEPVKIIGRKCHEALFGRSSPCENCPIETKTASETGTFRLKPARTRGGQTTIYDVFSQEISFSTEDRSLFVNLYHDATSQIRFERQILESTKMAELGTIGSSIAHELNNPLGGMLSFLQLIKMDLKGDEPWFEDITEMEKGALRCRDIVQSLLGFTRKSSIDTVETLDLREVVDQALKITELQTRAMGIKVFQERSETPLEARGQFNSLSQAIRNFLQNAQEAISERLRSGDKRTGEIRIRIVRENEIDRIEIHDNGIGFDSLIGEKIYAPMYTTKDPNHNPGLGLTVAQQIISDHGGSLEIRSSKGMGTQAIISLPRLVFDP